MEYPRDFSPQAEARVEAVLLRAYETFDKATGNFGFAPPTSKIWALLDQCIMSIFAAFAKEACELGRQNVWKVAKIESEAREFLREIIFQVRTDRGRGESARFLSDKLGSLGRVTPNALLRFQEFKEWKDYEHERLEVADIQANTTPSNDFNLVRRATRLLGLGDIQRNLYGPVPPIDPTQWPNQIVPVPTSDVAQPDTSEGKHPRRFKEPKPELLKNVETVNKSQAAEALGVSKRTLDRYVADNLLTPVGDYARRRFKTKDLISFMTKRKKDK
jgi:hypothetical protein